VPVTVKYALEQNFGEPAPEKPSFPVLSLKEGNYGMGLGYKNCSTFEPSRA